MKKNKKIYLCLSSIIIGGAIASTSLISVNKQIKNEGLQNKGIQNMSAPIAYAGGATSSTGGVSTAKYTLQQFIADVNNIPANVFISKIEAQKIKKSVYFSEYSLSTWEKNKQDQIQNRLFELFEDETDGFTKLEKIKLGQLILINHGYLQYFQNLGFDNSILNTEASGTNKTVIDPLSNVELISNHHNFNIIKTTGYETSKKFHLGEYDKIVNIDHQHMIDTLFALMKQEPTFKADFIKLKDANLNKVKNNAFVFPDFVKDIQTLMMKFLGEKDLSKNIWNIHPLLKLLKFSKNTLKDNFKEFLKSDLGGYLYGKTIKTKLKSFENPSNQRRLLLNCVNDVAELFIYGVSNTQSTLVNNLIPKSATLLPKSATLLPKNQVNKLLFLIKQSIVKSENFTKLVHWRIAGDFFNGYNIYISADFSEWENITLEKDSIVSVPVFQEAHTNYSKVEKHVAISKPGNSTSKQINNFGPNAQAPDNNSQPIFSKNNKESDKSVMDLDANSEIYFTFDLFNKESNKYNTHFSNKNTRKTTAEVTPGAVNQNYFKLLTQFNLSKKGVLVPTGPINKTNLNLGVNFLVGEKGTKQAIHLKKWKFDDFDLVQIFAEQIKKAREEEEKIKVAYAKKHKVNANQLITNIYISSILCHVWMNTSEPYKDGNKHIKWTSPEIDRNSFTLNFNVEIEQV